MIIKSNLNKLKRVMVAIYSEDGAKFSNGRKSNHIPIYDTTPDEVLKVITRALEQASS